MEKKKTENLSKEIKDIDKNQMEKFQNEKYNSQSKTCC